jgi:hypothetical protein
MLANVVNGEDPATLAINGQDVAILEPMELVKLMKTLGAMARGKQEKTPRGALSTEDEDETEDEE